jgi:hypothetical protein
VRDGIKQARSALRRGDPDGALVILWNEVEPARLAGDRRSLRAIGGLATTIAERGEEGQQAEAQRLLEVLQRAEGEGDATAVLGADVRAAGYEPRAEDVDVDVEEPQASGFRWGGLVWLLIFIGVVIINILSGTQD